jgi:NAD(P)-dependent dehydrogenase (short-subunit alcohol dehydrogenase family)
MLISQGNLKQDALKGEVAVVTGAGRGIGYEAARALIWLGANVVVAEVNEMNGRITVQSLDKQFGAGRAIFVKTDVGIDEDVERLVKEANAKWGKVDIVVNNATVFPMGAVKDTPIDSWDYSYRVNLRGPVMLAKAFLADMIKRKHGVFVCVSSSGAAPYMGAYEVFKTAQGELASTIAAEVEDTGVYAFTIGPGIVKTPGFVEGGGQVASLMGITLEQLLEMNKRMEITPEAAGTGFAAAVALASKYHGQETSSIQALNAIGISVGGGEEEKKPITRPVDNKQVTQFFQPVLKTYIEQSQGWKDRNIFQRQWIFRDFKKNTGMSVDEMLDTIKELGDKLELHMSTSQFIDPLNQLAGYYEHQIELLKGFEKIQKKRQEGLDIIASWIREVQALVAALKGYESKHNSAATHGSCSLLRISR